MTREELSQFVKQRLVEHDGHHSVKVGVTHQHIMLDIDQFLRELQESLVQVLRETP